MSFIFCILLFASTSTARDAHHNIVKFIFVVYWIRCTYRTLCEATEFAPTRHDFIALASNCGCESIDGGRRETWSATKPTTYVCADNETIEMSSKFCDTFHHQLTHRTPPIEKMEMVSCAQRISVELISKMRRNQSRSIFPSSSFHSFIPFIYLCAQLAYSATTLIGGNRCVPPDIVRETNKSFERVLVSAVGCQMSPGIRMRLIYSYSTFDLHRSTLSPVFRSRAGVYDTQLCTSISLLFQRKPIETDSIQSFGGDACRLHMCCARGRYLYRSNCTSSKNARVQITWWGTVIFVNIISQISARRAIRTRCRANNVLQ